MQEVFDNIGYGKNINLIAMRNQYCPCDQCPPWYRVNIDIKNIEFVIGWRKSVIHLDWKKSGKDLSHLFVNENVTKDKDMIHCHGYNKLEEYLTKIISAL